jgi:hypothetical protein
MAATAEWIEIPWVLTSPYATINLNADSGDRYLLLNGACEMGAEIRSTSDNVPQADGSILHHRFFTGYQAKLSMMLWVGDELACGADLVRMIDTLNGVCWSLLNAGDNEGRLAWLPTGESNYRMIDDVRLIERMQIAAPDAGTGWVVSFALDSAFPYAQDLTQQSTALDAIITNTGTAAYWPVIKVFGATSGFTLSNMTTGLEIVYNDSLPGAPPIPGGSYVEIDTFRNTAYINGTGADAMPGFVLSVSDFWALEPGVNNITIAGATATVLWAPAWA